MSHSFNEARVKVAHPYLTMMGLYPGGFTGMFSETCLNIASPQLGVAFGVDTAITQWLVIGYMLVIGLVMPFASILMKWFSVRKLTLFSLGAFIAGSLVSGCAPTFEVLLFGRLVQGIGTGLILPMMFSMVLEVFPPCKIGAAMGVTALIIMSLLPLVPRFRAFFGHLFLARDFLLVRCRACGWCRLCFEIPREPL